MRDTTYFIVGDNALRFDKIKWYKFEYGNGYFATIGNSGDFWFNVYVDLPEQGFSLKRWMNDSNYKYRAYPSRKINNKEGLIPYNI